MHADKLVIDALASGDVSLPLATKLSVEGRDVPSLAQSFEQGERGDAPVVFARYLSPSVRKRLEDAGISYVDSTGNVLFRVRNPMVYVRSDGADSDPWRGQGRPLATLKGAPAAKVVRAMLDYSSPQSISTLLERSEASTGSLYRVIEHLTKEGIIWREGSGGIVLPEWQPLLRAWSEDYGFIRSNSVTRWIAPRGLDVLARSIAAGEGPSYAVTGTLAAEKWEAYAPARSALIYVEDARAASKLWGLREADAGANVLLAEPGSDTVFQRRESYRDLRIAAPAQVAVDLLTGPGRSPTEAEELIAWMERNERIWRRD